MALLTSTLDSVIVVWHVAVNAGDADTAASACTDDVVLTGPHGSVSGRDQMREWVRSAGIRLMPKEAWDVPGGIVVAQEVTRIDSSADGDPEKMYTAFGLRDGSISGVHRFTTLDEARACEVAA